jgi:4-diphosphocytidyl-2-C-methyl-D-erythritol kinase
LTLKGPSSYHPPSGIRFAKAFAPAKLNLHLEVGARRPDGFHGIRSLFQAISLGDRMEAERVAGADVDIKGNFGFPTAENIIHRACLLFFDFVGERFGLRVKVEKAIPLGAGLGGGSSDAASMLLCLNALLGTPASAGELAGLAASLGSDVPFFLGGACAWIEGRGDVVEAMDARGDLACLLAYPGFPVGTARAYADLDASRPDPEEVVFNLGKDEAGRAYAGSPRLWPFFNSFEDAVFGAHPGLQSLKDAMRGEGALAAGMSGSGSAIYGIFGNEEDAEGARERLAARGVRTIPAFLLARGQGVIVE